MTANRCTAVYEGQQCVLPAGHAEPHSLAQPDPGWVNVPVAGNQQNLARTVRSVQNMQLMLLAGIVAGAIVGFLLSAYVVVPMMGLGGGAFVAFFVVIPVSAFIGQRLVLWALAG